MNHHFHKQSIHRRLAYLMLQADVDGVRFMIACSSLAWALLLLWPGATFDRQTYALMRAVAPEVIWAVAHLVHGSVAIYSVLTGHRSRLAWVVDPILGCLLWTTSAAAMLLAVYPVPAAIAPQIVGALASWWLMVRYEVHR